MINFTPKIGKGVRELLKNRDLLYNIGRIVGYPYSIILPQEIEANIRKFRNVFKKHNMTYKIFFAHKCNKSSSILKECLKNNINIDVSSINELKHSLENGFIGQKILATGPKNKEFIWLALEHGVTLSIDSFAELEIIALLSKELNKKANILIRINNANSNMLKKKF